MQKKYYIRFTLVLFILGLMISILYNTIQNPTERDTRDIWAIRQELTEEKQLRSELLAKIRSLNGVIDQYEENASTSPRVILNETVDNLRMQAGLTNIEGPGLILRVEPAEELVAMGYDIKEVSPDLLIQLVNEMYRNNGENVEIDGNRIVQTTSIRDINGQTTVNSIPLKEVPFEIRVGTSTFDDAEKLYNYLFSSSISDSFYLDNFKLVIERPKEKLRITAYDKELKNSYLIEADKGE